MPVGRSLLALLLAAAAGFAAELHSLDGKTLSGELVRVTDKEVVLRADGKEVSTPIEQVLQIDLGSLGKPGAAKYADLELADGTLLHCTRTTFKGKEVEAELVSGPKVKLPLDAVGSWYVDAQDAKVRQDWKDLVAKKRNSDVILAVLKGEQVSLPGTFGDAADDGTSINFDLNSQGSPGPVEMEKIRGMIFLRQPNPKALPLACKLHDTQGDVVMVGAVEVTDAGFTVTTPAGVKIDYPKAAVARLDYTKDKVVYLSDMEPAKVAYSSTEDKPEPFRRDKNLDGDPLQLKKTTFAKGLAIHSTTVLEYDLGGDYRELRAWIGVDDRVGGTDGPTRVKIEGDGRELYSVVVSRKDPPPKEPTVVNVKDVRRLRITVASGDLLDLGRHVDLADAKVSK
jgi:NPCBM/NEW2 domain